MEEDPPAHEGLRVVVFTCGSIGVLVANGLSRLAGVGSVTLFRAPWRSRGPQSFAGRLREAIRMDGAAAVSRRLLQRLAGRRRPPQAAEPEPELAQGVALRTVADLHDPATLDRVRDLAPDLGVVAGTYILRESLFSIPRLGSINLHSGKAPEYRGAAPAFWELYNGEDHVGITIHRVARKVDAGGILLQELFPLERAPAGDPLVYLDRYRIETLRPHGVRLLCDAVSRIAAGEEEVMPQDPRRARTYRTPDFRAKQELRRRVAERRREVRAR